MYSTNITKFIIVRTQYIVVSCFSSNKDITTKTSCNTIVFCSTLLYC